MNEQDIMDEIDVAAGYGLAALCLQGAIAAQLALQGIFSPQNLTAIAEASEHMAGARGQAASDGAVLIAQSAIRGLAQTWKRPDKKN